MTIGSASENGGAEGSLILVPAEAENFIENLTVMEIEEIGGQRWMLQHEHTEQLNLQAQISAQGQHDEYVKELFISCGKLPVIVGSLLSIELWKKHVFPILCKIKFAKDGSVGPYMTIYNEVTLVSLLETILYHKEALTSLAEEGDCLLEIADYCHRKLTALVYCRQQLDEGAEEEELTMMRDPDKRFQGKGTEEITKMLETSPEQDLIRQKKALEFQLCMKCLTIVRYMTDHLDDLGVSVLNRVTKTHDMLIVLCTLLENPPWAEHRQGGVTAKYDAGTGKWVEFKGSSRLQLSKTEVQAWLCVYSLVMNPNSRGKCNLSVSYRKERVLNLRKHFNEVFFDQIPMMSELQRLLEEMSMINDSTSAIYGNTAHSSLGELCIEQMPELRTAIYEKYKSKWKSVAEHQLKSYFKKTQQERMDEAKRLANMYAFDALENYLPDSPKCSVCGSEATKRCSRCQNEWYCRRECQVSHWPKHKSACDLLVNARTETSAISSKIGSEPKAQMT
eukprot:Nk52_evm13s1360 gene=Nk52_evmTU13s1360